MIRRPYRALEKALGYKFRRQHRLELALTHPSFRFETLGVESDNQRLEFLGDAALGLVSAAYLFEHYPEFQEGQLTQVRSHLTNTRTLARIAAAILLGNYLKLGRGEQLSGGQHRSSTLSDALEAIIGAAYIDGGLRAVEKIFGKLFEAEIQPGLIEEWTDNPKGALQELCQREWHTSPRYRTIREEGPAHSRTFTVEVSVNGTVHGTGEGANKREAETVAARAALRQLKDKPEG